MWPQADQVHLDAGLFGVPDGAVRNAVEIEVAAELAIDAHQQIAIERRGDAERIVVASRISLGFDEIGAEEQRVAVGQRRTDSAEKRIRTGRIEVPDVRQTRTGVTGRPRARVTRCGPARPS